MEATAVGYQWDAEVKAKIEDFEQVGPGQWAKKQEAKPDPINHPEHYTQGKIEVIEFLEDQQMPFHEASAVAYICRARFKGNQIQDLEKAIWYLNRRIKLLGKTQNEGNK